MHKAQSGNYKVSCAALKRTPRQYHYDCSMRGPLNISSSVVELLLLGVRHATAAVASQPAWESSTLHALSPPV